MSEIGIGNACNNNCIMCTAIVPPKKEDAFKNTDLLKKKIDELVLKTDEIAFTGGEPTIHKDLFFLLKYINKKNSDVKIHLITNSRVFFYKSYIEKLKKINKIHIHTELYGSTPELHDDITLTKGSFRQTLQGIKNLINSNIPVNFRIVISKLNYKDVPNIALLINKELNEIQRVVAFPIDIVGNAFKNKKLVSVRFKELIPYLEKSLDILKKNNIKAELYHVPFCVIDKKYHKFINKGLTVPSRRVKFSKVCQGCLHGNSCPRVWRTYLVNFGEDEFHKIK